MSAMQRRDADVYASLEEADRIIDELGVRYSGQDQGWSLLMLGDLDGAEAYLRAGLDAMLAKGSVGLAATTAALLSQALLAAGRIDEADEMARRAEQLTAPDDVSAVVPAWCVQAECLARGGEHDRAGALAERAVTMADGTDWLEFQGEARLHQARVMRAAGRRAEAAQAAHIAIDRFEQKGNLAYAAQARALLSALA